MPRLSVEYFILGCTDKKNNREVCDVFDEIASLINKKISTAHSFVSGIMILEILLRYTMYI